MSDKVLVLRTCDKDLKSRGGFQYPESGPVEAPDWDGKAECGGGLHGLPWGEGNGRLLDWSYCARWIVIDAAADNVIAFDGKCKFARGVVVYCGDRSGATEYIATRGGDRSKIVGAKVTGGNYATVTGGNGAKVTGGVGAKVTGGNYATVCARWWDGTRYRIAVGYVGEDGIEPNVAYRVGAGGKWAKA
jgi:hypothetical protein